jgi:hypothetical protein
MKKYTLYLVLICLVSCNKGINDLDSNKLFTNVPAEISGVTFQNKILESERLHYYKYQYIYIGGGVAAADFNNDGLQDLFFTSNIYSNKLFLNKGDFKFEDITEQSGIVKRAGFDVGISIADVNNDGFVDIYINRAGWYTGDEKLANMLYINNGDLTFTEQAVKYGLADPNRSISSTFFDYDLDGDLDVYITNSPSDFNLSGTLLDLKQILKQKEKIEQSKSSDKLYRNNGNGFFDDVSEQAGILPDLGFGLHAQVSDLNNDGWPDIYVSNDFVIPDFAYINNGDGTFTDKKEELFKHISYYSMGGDFADINNDGLPDLMVADMSPEDYVRSKTTMSMMSIDKFDAMTANGYHHQYMHNVLQLNNGKNKPFSEIANLSGVSKTDWSWAALFADFDLDGYNDLYVTNGVYRDVVDRDANAEIDKYIHENKGNLSEKDFFEFTQKLPQQKLKNYLFKNDGNLTFSNKTEDWSNIENTFSNGAVYVDLDNDGDLDIVTNNLDENATLLRNNAREIGKNNFLEIKFKGPEKNKFGLGTQVKVYKKNGDILVRELINARGYLSSMPNTLHFGLGEDSSVEKIEVVWFDGKTQILKYNKVNQTLTLSYAESVEVIKNDYQTEIKTLFTEQNFNFFHIEIPFKDYDKQLLLPHKLSQTGPAIAKADVNDDGLDDIFIGGAHNQEAQLLIATKFDGFIVKPMQNFITDKAYEDVSACFFDADNDGDQDLYVVSGSYEFDENSPLLEDRLYINTNSNFKKSTGKIPSIKSAGSIVKAGDFDNDGDVDLFIGSRVIPGRYPYAPVHQLLINDGGVFKNTITSLAPELENIGMINDAQWVDINNDKSLDLVVTGEWMGIEVFINKNGTLSKHKDYASLASKVGWWNTIEIADVDGDGDSDIIAGNLGLNYKFQASDQEPFHIYTNDFDKNGTEDIFLAKDYNGKQVPVRGKSCSSQQIPSLKEKIKTYNEFANADLQGILGDEITTSLHYKATEFRSGIFINDGNNQFTFQPFSIQAQISPITGIIYEDLDGDGIKDMLLVGNNYQSEVETTRADAGIGTYYKGESAGKFKYLKNNYTGLLADKDVRKVMLIKTAIGKSVVVANNNDKHQLFSLKSNL